MIVDRLIEIIVATLSWLLSLLPEWSPWSALQNVLPYDVMRLLVGITTGFLATFTVGVALWVFSWVRGMSK